MIIKSIKLINFRNLEDTSINLNSHINIFFGENGQGKTNFVESIGFLSLLKSFRKCETHSLIKQGCEFATIIANDFNNNEYKIIITEDSKKVYFNNSLIRKHSDFIGLINTITFSPEDCLLFKTSPKDRRDFIDDEISKISPAYNQFLIDYNKIRLDRNELLKSEIIDDSLLETYSKRLSIYGLKIINKRSEFLKKVSEKLTHFYSSITGEKDIIKFEYDSELIDKNEEEIYQLIQSNINEDKVRKMTCKGPHKDDFIMYLNNKEISEYGSQGQNRIAVIALKLSILNLIKEIKNDDPIVILDDVLSELDGKRKNNLLNELINKNQLLITCTNDIKIDQNVTKFEIKKGIVGGC